MTEPSSAAPKPQSPLVFLIDVDNTLLDNDFVIADLRSYLALELGERRAQLYFDLFEERRNELGYADYLGALQSYRSCYPRDPHVLALSSFLINYPFAERLFPGALDVLARLAELGPTVILSDGDVVFQPLKVQRSGIFDAVDKRVLIYVHKEHELDDVEARFPAEHYVLIDDKLRILTAVKREWGQRVTTVFPRQGHYAFAAEVAQLPAADVSVDRIAELLSYDLRSLRTAARAAPESTR
jgi:FMN phosphatase YigB (HAD superfamily)